MSKHTPTPWHAHSCQPHGFDIDAADSDGMVWTLGNISGEANAAFIVKAVNSHDALVSGIKKVIEMNVQEAIDRYGHSNKAESWSCVKVLRAALAAAGESHE